MIAAAALIGATFGFGVWLIAWALRPAPRPLAEVINGPPPPSAQPGAVGRITGWLHHAGVPVHANAADLAITGGSVERLLLDKLRYAATAAILPFAGVVLARFLGVGVPLAVAAMPALLFAVVGWMAPDLEVRSRAKERREEFTDAFAAYLDLVTILLAGGAGPETACYAAASTGRGWAFDALIGALDRAQLQGISPWASLSLLAEDLQVVELRQFADATGLAGRQGAHVRDTLTARAEAMRTRRLQNAGAKARQATERMTMPMVGLGLAFLTWLLFPALIAVLGI